MLTILLLFLFMAPTVQARMQLGFVNLAFMEPVVLVVSGLMILRQVYFKRTITLPRNNSILFFFALLIWSFVLGILSPNTKLGFNDIRAWFIPALGFVALLTVKDGWVYWMKIYALSVVVNSLLGIVQYWANSFRYFVPTDFSYQGYRTAVIVVAGKVTLVQLSFAAGFFGHPNGYAMYLLSGLMILLGYAWATKTLWAKVLAIPIVLALILSFSKTSIIMMAILLAAFVISQQSRERKIKIYFYLSFSTVFGLAAAIFLLKYLPLEIFTTLYWRFGLWQIALDTIVKFPLILMIGNGLELFGSNAYYWQPHSLYVSFLLLYGVPGLLLILAILLNTVHSGYYLLSRYVSHEKFMVIGVWFSILVFFLVGMTESSLLSIEDRMIFLTHIAFLIGLRRELDGKDMRTA